MITAAEILVAVVLVIVRLVKLWLVGFVLAVDYNTIHK
jgi:hypothetical protein